MYPWLIGGVVLAAVVLVTVVVAAAMAGRNEVSFGESLTDPVILGTFAAAVALAAVVGLGLSVLFWTGSRRSRRLTAFAQRNALSYQSLRREHDDLPATAFFARAFGDGQRGWTTDVVVDHRARRVEHGKVALTRGGESGASRESWGYVAVRLAVSMPHVAILRRRGLRRRTGLFRGLRHLQREVPQLPGFDRRFVVLCPPGSEQDVAAIVVPELFDRWAAAGFDVEILGPWLVLFRRRPVVTLNPGRWQEIAAATALLDARLTAWEQWRTAVGTARRA